LQINTTVGAQPNDEDRFGDRSGAGDLQPIVRSVAEQAGASGTHDWKIGAGQCAKRKAGSIDWLACAGQDRHFGPERFANTGKEDDFAESNRICKAWSERKGKSAELK
jgi:hypothetical protein